MAYATVLLAVMASGTACANEPPPPINNEGGYTNPVFVYGPNVSSHFDKSYGAYPELWSELRSGLKACGGYFLIYAYELGYLRTDSGLLPLLKQEGIPIAVELHGMTQPIKGDVLARAELYGDPVDGVNIFQSIFRIPVESERTNPDLKGWFVGKDRKAIVPDLILFDERQPNLCPTIDPMTLATTPGTFDERLKAAAQYNHNVARYRNKPFDDLLATLREDYILFCQVAKEKWGEQMPDVGLHWNVIVGWEWRDQGAMKAIHEANSTFYHYPGNFHAAYKTFPQHSYKSVEYLARYIDEMEAAGCKPVVVCMDVDWNYDLDYVEKILNMHKAMLKTKGVQLSINVVEGALSNDEELYYNAGTLQRRTRTDTGANQLYENTLVSITQWLIDKGIYERGMQLRVGSWTVRPIEPEEQIDETVPGSMAHTANLIYKMMPK